jgi:hypothetical protein
MSGYGSTMEDLGRCVVFEKRGVHAQPVGASRTLPSAGYSITRTDEAEEQAREAHHMSYRPLVVFTRETSNKIRKRSGYRLTRARNTGSALIFRALYNVSRALLNCCFFTSAPAGRHKTIAIGRFAATGSRTINTNSRNAEIWTHGIWHMEGSSASMARMDPVHERLNGVLVLPAWYC